MPPEARRALIAYTLLPSLAANTLHGPVHLDAALGRAAQAGSNNIAGPKG